MSTPDPTTQHTAPVPPQPAEPRRRSWFRRHKILTALGAVVLVAALANMVDGDDSSAPTAADKTSSAPVKADEGGADPSASSKGSTADGSASDETDAEESADDTTSEEATEEEASEEAAPADTLPAIGDTVEVGDFEATVTAVESGISQIGSDSFGEKAQGQFVKVSMTVKNNGKKAEYFLESEQKLIDEQEREHSTANASWQLGDESLVLTEINPGNTASGALLFDIPADATPVSIKLSGGFFGTPVEVSLGD